MFCFCMSYLKPNTNQTKRNPQLMSRYSHVKHCSHVEHRFLFFSRNTGEREALLMKHCSDVKHSSLDVNLCMSVEFVLSLHVCGHIRTGLDYSFLMLCNVLDERHVSRNATTCMLLRMSGI